jgi:ribosomal protein S14
MTRIQTSNYCATCGRQTLHTKDRVNHVLHLLLSIVTVGLWAVFVWIPLGMKNSAARTRCSVCGSKPGLESLKVEVLGRERGPEPVSPSREPPASTWLPPGARPPR